MLTLSSRLIGMPVLSVQASGSIATISAPIVDPDSLKIVAFYVSGPLVTPSVNILDASSVREFSPYGFVVDSIDEFVTEDDVVRLSQVIALHFDLLGLKVVTKKGTKLGKISNFTITDDNFTVQQLIVKRPAIKSFLDPELTIPRSEIIEVDDYKVTVRDEEKTIRERAAKEDFVPNFVNPFRKQEPARAPSRTQTPADTDTE